MSQVDQNINKDMDDSDLIDLDSLDFSDNQTWLYTVPGDSGQKVDITEFCLSCDWPIIEDEEYLKAQQDLNTLLDNLLKNDADDVALPDKHKFDSRTYVKPKKRVQRPSIQSIVEVASNHSSMSPHPSLNPTNKYLTYNKYSNPLGPISPMIRLKTFNVDTNSENSLSVKEYAMKRRSVVLPDDDPQLEDQELTLVSDASDRLSDAPKAINIDLSQPAHNLHNTFTKGLTNMMNDRGSLGMYHSGESLMRMSPPSLVSSLMMESSGTFNPESLDGRLSTLTHKTTAPPPGRESIDPMLTSMTLSILDEKDMNTSFLSQTTNADNNSLIDSLPPSLVSSVNSSYVISNSSKPKDSLEPNIYSTATYTHIEQSERLLSARPRCQLYNSYTKRDSGLKNCESYVKSREEPSQIDPVKILNGNPDSNGHRAKNEEINDVITLHYSNNKFSRKNDAEKENLRETTFETDDAFFKDMQEMQKTVELANRNSLNITLDKQELNEIIQARQKLSLARKALPLPGEAEKLPNQVDASVKTIQLPNQTITVPRTMENVSEILSRRRGLNIFNRQEEHSRDTPKRSATYRKVSPKINAMDATHVFVKEDEQNIIDINSATMNLLGNGEPAPREAWGTQDRAMVGSSESTGTDTCTFSSSSPPDSVPDTARADPRLQVASTPLDPMKKGRTYDMLNIHNTISPIYDIVNEKPNASHKPADSSMERTYDAHQNMTVINSATIVKKTSAKRDILAGKTSPEKFLGVQKYTANRTSPTAPSSCTSMVPPQSGPRKKSALPTSKLRQYSSHKELNRIPGNPTTSAARVLAGRTMERRGVYASNPALSPTAPAPPAPAPVPAPAPAHAPALPSQRRDSYTLVTHQKDEDRHLQRPALVRQGTETLRRERPQSQLVVPKDVRAARTHMVPPQPTRPYSIAGASQIRVARPMSVPIQRPQSASGPAERPASHTEARASALPRPSRLPAPRRALRPPSVYSVAPTEPDMDL